MRKNLLFVLILIGVFVQSYRNSDKIRFTFKTAILIALISYGLISNPVEANPVSPSIERRVSNEDLDSGSKSSAVHNLLKLSSGDLGKGSSPGARGHSDARKAINNRAKAPKSC